MKTIPYLLILLRFLSAIAILYLGYFVWRNIKNSDFNSNVFRITNRYFWRNYRSKSCCFIRKIKKIGQSNRFGFLVSNWIFNLLAEFRNHKRPLEKYFSDFWNGSFVLHHQFLEIRERNLHTRLVVQAVGIEFIVDFHFFDRFQHSQLDILFMFNSRIDFSHWCQFDYSDSTEVAIWRSEFLSRLENPSGKKYKKICFIELIWC